MYNDYLLSNKLCCRICGTIYTGEMVQNVQKRKYFYYTCREHRKAESKCSVLRVPTADVEKQVAEQTLELLNDEVLFNLIVDNARAVMESEQTADSKRIAIEARLKEITSSIENLTIALEHGVAATTILNRIAALEEEQKLLVYEMQKYEG